LPLTTWAVEIKAIDNATNITQRIIYDWSALSGPYFFLWFVIILVAVLVINRAVRGKVYNNKSNG